MALKPSWVEVNVSCGERIPSRELMAGHVFPLVDRVRRLYPVSSWHYFFEPDVRLRFLTDAPVSVARYLAGELREIRRKGMITDFYFGAHGAKGKRYEGEESVWGKDEWPLAMKMYEQGAEVAKSLMQLKLPSARLQVHAERYVHLLLNQLGYSYLAEAQFYGSAHDGALIMVAVTSALGEPRRRRKRH